MKKIALAIGLVAWVKDFYAMQIQKNPPEDKIPIHYRLIETFPFKSNNFG
jgi:hypothetical protein